MGIVFPSGQHLNLAKDSKVLAGTEEIATLKSSCYSPTLDATIAIASVKRDYRVPNKVMHVTVMENDYEITIHTLPFVQHSDQAQARKLYEQALQDYATESESVTEKNSVALLRKAIRLDPNLQDAYEALGVILSKQDKLDEAIDLMEKLAAINPDSVMAHTNLSVFYVEKGWIEKAEDEKAISMSIRMKAVAQQVTADAEAKQQKAQARIDAQERMGMFREVLEIDADDLLANYGVGSCSVALDQFAEAIPFLTKAISIKPSYTVAYLALGQAYHGLGKIPEAVQAYEQGIEVASKRGDLSPMKDMQAKLDAARAELKKC
jgi:tetratricopeptide (TPR) repeat protein